MTREEQLTAMLTQAETEITNCIFQRTLAEKEVAKCTALIGGLCEEISRLRIATGASGPYILPKAADAATPDADEGEVQ